MSIKYVVLISAIFFCGSITAQPVINSINTNNDYPGRYATFELSVGITASYINPYNPQEVTLRGTFLSPDGDTFNIEGFYYQSFQEVVPDSLVATGPPVWKIRHTPDLTGTWWYYVTVTDSTGSATSSTASFVCISSPFRSFLTLDTVINYFVDNLGPVILTGENLCWGPAEGKFHVFYNWIDNLKANNANFIKIMMTPWSFELEWQDTSIGDYSSRQSVAWALDAIINYAYSKGIYTQLAFVIHGEYQSGNLWNQNPYNAANGGPCINPQDFFTDSIAQYYFDRKLQYIINRWAYHIGIAAWEIISEADMVEAYQQNKQAVREWILEKAAYMKTNDPYQHPVTAAYAISENDTVIWKSNLIDFVQTHIYDDVPDLEMKIYAKNLEYLEKYHKPVINGEFGLYYNPDSAVANDPDGITIHNVLWATLMSGTIGSGLSWWWDNYIHPQNLYYHFKEVSGFGDNNIFMDIFWESTPLEPGRYDINTQQTIDEKIKPGFGAFLQKAPASVFTMEQSGLFLPGTSSLGSTLYGNGFVVAQFRNPPAFMVNYADNGFLEVRTGGNVVNSKLKISVDSIQVLLTDVVADSSYVIPVSKGQHKILVENASAGNGIMEIESYNFIHHSPMLKALMISQKHSVYNPYPFAIGWIQHRKYNWLDVLNAGMPDTITSARLFIPDSLADAELYFSFYNTITGQVIDVIVYDPGTDSGFIVLPAISSDVAVAIDFAPHSIDEKNPAGIFSMNVFPNPLTEQATIHLDLRDRLNISVKIFDISGRMVATLIEEDLHTGQHSLSWDGRNSQGSVVKPGIYLVVADDGINSITSKLVKY